MMNEPLLCLYYVFNNFAWLWKLFMLTQWVSPDDAYMLQKMVTIGSHGGLVSVFCQATTWTNAVLS